MMKKTILFTAIIFVTGFSTVAQNVNIPDANFKAYLLGEPSINTNLDTEIQVSEANAFTGTISCNNMNIIDLTGIEAFTSMSTLLCTFNSINTIDISNNTSLTALNCSNNPFLNSLDVSVRPNLIELAAFNCNLSSLDLSLNTSLQWLTCSGNNITTLDLSECTNLIEMNCHDNDLYELNLKNIYPVIVTINATNNPNLDCIEVDDVSVATANWTNIDATASFSLDCNYNLGLTEGKISEEVTLFPNPATSQLTIQTENKILSALIVNALGQSSFIKLSNNELIDVSYLSKGVYMLQIETDKGFATKKFIKE